MKLFIVATPIGNLDDISLRARDTLASVDFIAAEDTRHSAVLLRHLGIETPTIAYHDHNEAEACEKLIAKIQAGSSIALVSDAGTPLISDPGYKLVQLAHTRGVEVVPIPGPSAMLAALCVAGLPTDRFVFVGFLSAKSEARAKSLEELSREAGTLVFYESRHRIAASLEDMSRQLGPTRLATLCRELTKRFEQVVQGTLADLCEQIADGTITPKGEFVVVVSGAVERVQNYDHVELMRTLLAELPPRKAAGIASKLTGEPSKMFYDLSLDLKKGKSV